MKITEDWHKVFQPSKMIFPVLIEHTAMLDRIKDAVLGWTDVFIFGIRVARIQRTRPWE